MAFVPLKFTLPNASRLGSLLGKQGSGLLCANSKRVALVQVATLKAVHGEKYPYSKPFNYKTRKLGFYAQTYDDTLARFNENTKVIIVDGNVGVGKDAFARRIASDFDLKYFPVTTGERFFTVGGYDLRAMNEVLTDGARYYDIKQFLSDPDPAKHWRKVGLLQVIMYKAKIFDYCHALYHLFSTGQGFVKVGSPVGDLAFAEALHKMGWITTTTLKYYKLIYTKSIHDIHPPHLNIYLHAPPSVLKERIKAKGDETERNSPTLSAEYLQAIDDSYKEAVFPRMKRTGELLEVDWAEDTKESDLEIITEELQGLKLEAEDNEDKRFQMWHQMYNSEEAMLHRKFYQDEVDIARLVQYPELLYCPELVLEEEDQLSQERVFDEHPAMIYEPGFRREFGEKNLYKPNSVWVDNRV